MGFSLNVNLRAITAQTDDLKKRVQEAARPAAKAVADVYYEAVKGNVAALGKSTGALHEAIYRVHSDDRSRDGRQIYEISWNRRKAPHGHLVEFGYMQRYSVFYDEKAKQWRTLKDRPLETPEQVAARPFLRPALDLSEQAKAAGVARLKELIAKPQS